MKKQTRKLSNPERATLEEKLQKLLYRKATLEHDIFTRLAGANSYSKYVDAVTGKLDDLKGKNKKDADILRLEMYKNIVTLRELISVYKELQREYEHFIIPSISDTAEKLGIELEGQEMINFAEKANEMVSKEHLNAVELLPANEELPQMIISYRALIELTEKVLDQSKKRLERGDLDELERSKLELFVYTENLRLSVLKRRHNARVEYHEKQFLPVYEKDMAEAKTLLPAYMSRAKEICRLGIDPKLCSMLQQYDSHKDDQEKKWLFYTALRKRVEEIRDYVLLNPDKTKHIQHLSNPITDELQSNRASKKVEKPAGSKIRVVKGRN